MPSGQPRGEVDASDSPLQQVLAAYAVLRDPAQRARYDRSRRPRPPRPAERRISLTSTPGTVVIGTIEQPRPAWIAPFDEPARTHYPQWTVGVG